MVVSLACVWGYPMSGYIFDNADERPTTQRFASLESLYDPRTTGFLEATGIGPGWRCLEIGGGSGSIAAWLADRVGSGGEVLVTDIDPRFLAMLTGLNRRNIEVRRHDITSDPLPDGAFDLIHARLVLIHIPTAPAVLSRMVAALKPGGWLVIEDFAPALIDRAFPVADQEDAAVVRAAFRALSTMVETRGAGPGWAQSLQGRFAEAGLEDVGTEGQLAIRSGGSSGALLDAANFTQVRDQVVSGGLLSGDVLDRIVALLNDPACTYSSPVMLTTWGRRP